MMCFSKTLQLPKNNQLCSPQPLASQVWPNSISLAATMEIEFLSFPVATQMFQFTTYPIYRLCIYLQITKVYLVRFPHSDIYGSQNVCFSPQLFAAFRVLHRLLVPRHPPIALISFAFSSYLVFNVLFYFQTLTKSMEIMRLELMTLCVQGRCSPN